jgi:hypothetical protein
MNLHHDRREQRRRRRHARRDIAAVAEVNAIMRNLQESLRALSQDPADADAQVPAHVDAAVMAAWDASRRDQAPAASRLWVPWAVACAAIVMTAVLLTWRPANPGAPSRAAALAGPLIQQELVLVPEFDRTGPLMLMRVRMTRREFSRLGVPISNPDGDGLVDVEVLVGEDGVARSIRRAVPVAWSGPNR